VDLDWLRAEAARQGLPLTDDDLVVIRDKVNRVRAALADCRWPELEGLEPAYHFEPLRAPQAPPAPRAARSSRAQRRGRPQTGTEAPRRRSGDHRARYR
jgi:hypothetical protein